ncbi:hypothetical protein [Cohnella sp. GCM10027633]|uniref:hypothetical protein n=1 Tax=unclassified Cohnella TaxID=2636738 RepID=UPI003632756B
MNIRAISRAATVAMLIAMLALAGCMYPDDNTPGGQATARESVLNVQDAIDRYYEKTGVLPIENADEATPLYEKYKIDLGKLQRTDYLGSVPPIAFEKGGRFQFIVIDEETKPLVKLLDLVAFQQVSDVRKKVEQYFMANGGGLPAGNQLYPGLVGIDFEKLGMDEPDVRSVYSNQPLPLMMDAAGRVYVDYGIDIATAMNKSQSTPTGDADLRRYLIDASYYVPVKSTEYRYVDGAPQAVDPIAKPLKQQ